MTESLVAGEPLTPETPAPKPPRPYPGFLAALGLVVLVHVIANSVAALVYVARFVASRDLNRVLDIDAAALGVVANSLAFGLVIWLALRRSGRRARDVFSFSAIRPASDDRPFQAFALYPGMILALGGALLTVNEVSNLLLRVLPIPDVVQDLFAQFLTRGWTGFVFLVVVAPITEELLFRGVLLRSFTERYGRRTAILGTAALFGAIHILPWQVVPAFFLGILFAWWTLGCRTLWPALIGHAVTNGIAFYQSQSLTPAEVFAASPQSLKLTLAGVAALVAGIAMTLPAFSRPDGREHLERSTL